MHYPAEMLQMVRYLAGEMEFDVRHLPLVIDDVNNGNISSLEKLHRERIDTRLRLERAERVLIEISSLKRIELDVGGADPLYAGVTATKRLQGGVCDAEFVDLPDAMKLASECSIERYEADRFFDDVKALVEFFGGRPVTLFSHFTATHPSTGQPIPERVRLGKWLADAATRLNCEFFDQSAIVASLGEHVALKDTSHFSDAGEHAAAISLREVIGGRDPAAPLRQCA